MLQELRRVHAKELTDGLAWGRMLCGGALPTRLLHDLFEEGSGGQG